MAARFFPHPRTFIWAGVAAALVLFLFNNVRIVAKTLGPRAGSA